MTHEPKSGQFSQHLAVFGTASDVGKSLLTSALCRLLSNAGYDVAPFKAQNMSNNAAVADDGGEIGRAQYVQAIAARIAPSVHHNPVLLKPMNGSRSQVVVRGQAQYSTEAVAYFDRTAALRAVAYDSLRTLRQQHDVIVVEGAGSCAEVNLRSREFVNFPVAHETQARVILVADIERGGVFAQIVGSLEVMPAADRARIAGVIVNKFRGDARLFDDGVRYLEQRTAIPVLGVIPYLDTLEIDAEDSLPLASRLLRSPAVSEQRPRVAVIAYPHIANFTDFDALDLEQLTVDYLRACRDLAGYSAVILPGSKAVVQDLAWLRACGLDEALHRYQAGGGKLLGVCGGLQMLGTQIEDPMGVESETNAQPVAGLGLLDLSTRFAALKTVRRCVGKSARDGCAVRGYEIHHGVSAHRYPPLFHLTSAVGADAAQPEGVRADERRIWGTYLHGLFDEPGFRHAFIRWVQPECHAQLNPARRTDVLEAELERFAHHVQAHLNWAQVLQWVQS